VDSFIFAADGQTVTASLGLTELATWNIFTGETVNKRPAGAVDYYNLANPNVVLSRNGAVLAEMIDEVRVGIWDVGTGQQFNEIQAETGHSLIRSLALSPDGSLLVTSSDRGVIDQGVTKFWDIKTGKSIQTFNTDKRPLLFSPDGSLLATGLQLWDIRQGKLHCELEENKSSGIQSLAFSPDSRLLASGKPDGVVEIWAVETCQQRQLLAGHTAHIISLVFSPDGKQLVSGSWDSTVRLWDIETGTMTNVLMEHWPRISDLVISSTGAVFVSPGFDQRPATPHISDREIQMWEVETGQIGQIFKGVHENSDLTIALSADGNVLVSGAHVESFVQLWDIKTGQPAKKIDLSAFAQRIALSPDGKKLAHTISGASWVGVYDTLTGELVTGETPRTTGGKLAGGNLAFVPQDSNKLLLAADLSAIWDLKSNQQRPTPFESSKNFSGKPVFSPDGSMVAIDNLIKGEMKVWNVETKQVIHILKHPPQRVEGAAFSPEGDLLATGIMGRHGQVESILIWDANQGTLLHTLPSYTSSVSQLAISSDGTLLISGSVDGTVRIWGIFTK
jgi:WD40 repeat protein